MMNVSRIFFSLAGGTALAICLYSCDTVQPEKVCTADETTRTVRTVLMDGLVGEGVQYERALMQQAFDEVVLFELIRFDGFDRRTKVTNCRTSVTYETGRQGVDLSYYRQPDVGSGGFVYGIRDFDPGAPAWRPLSLMVVGRYLELRDSSRSEHSSDSDLPPPSDAAAVQPSNSVEARTSPSSPTSTVVVPGPVGVPIETPNPIDRKEEDERVTDVPVRSERKVDRIEFTGPPGAAPTAGTARARRDAVANPEWSRAPNPEFPQRAENLGIRTGFVQVECEGHPNGGLYDCIVLSETPTEAGFGQAALSAARRAMLSPRTAAAVADGAPVRYSVPFRKD